MIFRRVPGYFQDKDLRLIIFGGKGGVGKTTMAATAALQLARSHDLDEKVLVVSTDPAHSLADSFDMPVGDKITPIEYRPRSDVRGPRSEVPSPKSEVRGVVAGDEKNSTLDVGHWTSDSTNLFALELDGSRLLEGFKQENGPVIKELADRGTYFDKEDISEFFDLSLPGMDEVMAIIEMANLLRGGEYRVLVLDTAPTGHTLRMLALPEQMEKWVEVMDLMQHKYRYIATHFSARKYKKDRCDLFLDRLSSDIDRVRRLLTNQEKTRFIPVTVPEPMSVYETKRLVSSLENINIPVGEMIVNRVAEEHCCTFCVSKKEAQTPALMQIEESFGVYGLIKVPMFPSEIHGIEGLMGLADHLMGVPRLTGVLKAVRRGDRHRTFLTIIPGLQFILFGGKGGVGKTTLASAAALHLAKANPQKRVLLFSTDPAHSLSDALDQVIGDKITPIEYSPKSEVRSPKSEVRSPKLEVRSPKSEVRGRRGEGAGQWAASGREGLTPQGVVAGDERNSTLDVGHWTSDSTNLFALEIDPDRLFDDFRKEFKDNIEEVFNRFLSRKVDIKFDREVMAELLTLAPPGLDEIMALESIIGLKERGEFDIFVLDTSPTGHLIRFLELPLMVREWLKAFFRLLLKYRGVVRLTQAAEKALDISRNVRRIQEILVDAQRTAFLAVTIPEAMGLLELERLSSALDNAQIPCEHIIVNMVVPENDCAFCSSRRAEQEKYLNQVQSRFSPRRITEVPLFPSEIHGASELTRLGKIVFGEVEMNPHS